METNCEKSTLDQILDAVMELIHDAGLPGVTLSAVCKRAGVSKGGLMHHFPNKEALIDAFMARAADSCLQSMHERLDPLSRGQGERVKAYIELMLQAPMKGDEAGAPEVASVMIALVQGRLTERAMDYYSRVGDALRKDGISTQLTELILVTVDGLWLQSAFLAADVVMSRAGHIRKQLIRLIDGELANKNITRRTIRSDS